MTLPNDLNLTAAANNLNYAVARIRNFLNSTEVSDEDHYWFDQVVCGELQSLSAELISAQIRSLDGRMRP